MKAEDATKVSMQVRVFDKDGNLKHVETVDATVEKKPLVRLPWRK